MSESFTVYFAGELFDHKDLLGNAFLAEAVGDRSGGRYECILPQDFDCWAERPEGIRNLDLLGLMMADLALFNFDGADIDSGTVAEFMFAKTLDIPALLVRSDIRVAGDQEAGGDPWNLMCSFYPRTLSKSFNAMAMWKSAGLDGEPRGRCAGVIAGMAGEIVAGLDAVRAMPPLEKGGVLGAEAIYGWAMRFPGASFESLCGEGFAKRIVARKMSKGLL